MEIVIVHHPEHVEALANLLLSLKGVPYHYHIFVNKRNNSGYEMAALEWATMHLSEDFVLLQDTVEVKNLDVFRILEEAPSGMGLTVNLQSYMGKYNIKVMKEQMPFVTVSTKEESIRQENLWTALYLQNDPEFTWFEPLLYDNPAREFKFGRENMVLENDYIKKYKGTWQ